MPEQPPGKHQPDFATGPRVVAAIGYAELAVASNFSFLRGASHPEELIGRAASLGHRAVALTDLHSFAGIVRGHQAAKEAGIPFVVGCRVEVKDALGVLAPGAPGELPALGMLLYATTRGAYGRICRLLTLGKGRAPKGRCFLTLQDVLDHQEGVLAVLLPPPFPYGPVSTSLGVLKEVFDGDRLSLAATHLYDAHDGARFEALAELSRSFGIPIVATNDVHYHVVERRALQDVVTCIRLGTTLEQAGFELFGNAERHIKTPQEMARLFVDYPQAIARTVAIAERAGFSLDKLRYEYPSEVCPAGKAPMEHLKELTWAGARQRYPDSAELPASLVGRLEHEFTLIGDLHYESYFLTVHDIVEFARSRHILCQGRGAAANSAVCYCLGITAVDPTRIDLLVERFISRERDEPPDIDVDFEHERREEVIQYIYQKYGRDRAALTGEVITYRRRSALRDVGKTLGLSQDTLDRLAKAGDWWDPTVMAEGALKQLGLNPQDSTLRLTVQLATEILGFPRHLSQHVGGFVISRPALCEIVPIENAAMPERTFIEWDKDDIDALGILKIDILALGMLTAIRKAMDMVNAWGGHPRNRGDGLDCFLTPRHRDAEDAPRGGEDGGIVGQGADDGEGEKIRRLTQIQNLEGEDEGAMVQAGDREQVGHGPANCAGPWHPARPLPNGRGSDGVWLELHTIPAEDAGVYAMLCEGDSVGVFQVESRAQMSMLPRLLPRCYYDLVIEVAIVRPGPIQGGMVHPYLRRRGGQEAIGYPSEAVKRVLERTLGVPLFQEQAMRLVMVAAGFSAGEADGLRRAMAAWKRKGHLMEKYAEKIRAGMLERGYTPMFAHTCLEQIKGFSEYGFPESHAASFALLVYVSAWLKKYHPAAFTAGLLNSQPMGFYGPAQLVRDAQEHGVKVLAVDVNYSRWDAVLEESGTTSTRSDEGTKDHEEGKRMMSKGLFENGGNEPQKNTKDSKVAGLLRTTRDRGVCVVQAVDFHPRLQRCGWGFGW